MPRCFPELASSWIITMNTSLNPECSFCDVDTWPLKDTQGPPASLRQGLKYQVVTTFDCYYVGHFHLSSIQAGHEVKEFTVNSENNVGPCIAHMSGVPAMKEPFLGTSNLSEALHYIAIKND